MERFTGRRMPRINWGNPALLSTPALNCAVTIRRAAGWTSAARLRLKFAPKAASRIQPQADQDEGLKLLALNSLMKQDELRALSEIQQILSGDFPEKFKERALFILAQGQSKQAQELLEQIAQERSVSRSASESG